MISGITAKPIKTISLLAREALSLGFSLSRQAMDLIFLLREGGEIENGGGNEHFEGKREWRQDGEDCRKQQVLVIEANPTDFLIFGFNIYIYISTSWVTSLTDQHLRLSFINYSLAPLK